MAYASKYYDPVKAHEYYMKHRKLKGRKKKSDLTPEELKARERRSTKTLNDYGKAAAKQVREQINAEKKAAIKAISQGVSDQVKALRKMWKEQGVSKEEISARVKEIREKAKAQKKKLRELYKEKYLRELDKIKQDSTMLKSKYAKSKTARYTVENDNDDNEQIKFTKTSKKSIWKNYK